MHLVLLAYSLLINEDDVIKHNIGKDKYLLKWALLEVFPASTGPNRCFRHTAALLLNKMSNI